MRKYFWFRITWAIILFVLAGCATPTPEPIPTITIEMVPHHPASNKIDSTSFEADLPWKIGDGRVMEGPYESYSIDGPHYYFYRPDNLPLPMEEFYRNSLTEEGWELVDQAIYLISIGHFGTGQAWVKGSQVVYLIFYTNPAQSTVHILAIYLLTK